MFVVLQGPLNGLDIGGVVFDNRSHSGSWCMLIFIRVTSSCHRPMGRYVEKSGGLLPSGEALFLC